MSEVTSFIVASVEKYSDKLILRSWYLTPLAVAGFGGLTNEVLHGQCAVVENAKAF